MPSAVPFLPAAEGDVPCPRARVTFGRSPKSDQKRCLKPQVSRLPARLGCAENRGRVPRENQDSADRRTTNRVRPSCRCRSCVPCGGALVYRRGRLSNRALAAAGKCRCGPSGCGMENHKRCKALSLYRTNGEISPVERGSGSGNVGDSGLCLRRFRFFQQRKGNVPCPRARVTFGRSPKSDQKRCLKPQVSRLPARLGCAENRGRVPRENQDSADRRTTNRVRPSCRCRSCVPCGGALVYRRGRLSNRALAAAGKCRCGPSGCGMENHKRCKALSLYRTNGEISPVERGSGSGNVGDSGLCLRRFRFFQQRKGNVPCPRARVTFGRSPKSDQKRCLKPQVSRLPARLGCAENRGRVPRENQDSADRRTTNRVRSSCRCRSCVPRGGALVYRRGQKAAAPEREMSLYRQQNV